MGWGRRENLEKASNAGRAGLGWLSQSGDRQEAGLYIPKFPFYNGTLWSWGSCSWLCAARRLGSFPEATAWGSRIPAGSPLSLRGVLPPSGLD